MFDVDCPRTPDGGDDDQKNGDNKQQPKPSAASANSSRPPLRSGYTPRGSVRKTTTGGATPRSAGRKHGAFSPRIPLGSRKKPHAASSGLEPEEYIIGQARRQQPPKSAPGPPRAPGSGGYRFAPGGGGGGEGNNRLRAHSTEAFGDGGGGIGGGVGAGTSTNPFDDSNKGDNGGGNRGRTSSGNWWREEIVDEGQDKGEAMEKYYGLNPGQKQELYGPTHPAGTAISANGRNGRNPFDDDAQPGGEANPAVPARHQHQHQLQLQNQQPAGNAPHGIPTQHNTPNSNAAQIYGSSPPLVTNGAGYTDDYSFSNVNLTTPGNSPGAAGGSPGGSRGRPSTPSWAANNSGSSNSNDGTLVQRFLRVFASKNDGSRGYLPPGMTSETNIAPRPRNSPAEWYPNSPKVTFDNDFHPDSAHGNRSKRGAGERWNKLSSVQKVGATVVFAALVCTVFGVMVSTLRNDNNAANGQGDNGASQAVSMPELPGTATPTLSPTTARPTRTPTTDSPIAGYFAIHGKRNDGTARPTRSPVTSNPTDSPTTREPTTSPTVNPTAGPSAGPTATPTDTPTPAPLTCADEPGEHSNHLANPKTCLWLDGKVGYSDRKDKNCGGRPVPDGSGGTVTYPTTELGNKCQRVCRLYNGCPDDTNDAAYAAAAGSSGSMSLMLGRDGPLSRCADKDGFFSNHLENPKDCAWLHNDKDGYTDRKDKNCGGRQVHDELWGTVVYPTTELGEKCRGTCELYNGCAGDDAVEEAEKAVEVGSAKPACRDKEGLFRNHLLNPKDCAWLYNDKEGRTDRKDKNCGLDRPMTELGTACVETCRIYHPPDDKCEYDVSSIVSHGHAMRSFSSPNYSFSSTEPDTVSRCTNGEGEYADHKGSAKPCSWLSGHGDDMHGDDGVTAHRQAKNCGSMALGGHSITELGRECPWSCRKYNDCGR